MSFAARCPFCHVLVSGVPVEHEGSSISCPRCENYFTLAAITESHVQARRHSGSHTTPGLAVKETCTELDTPPPPTVHGMPARSDAMTAPETVSRPTINRFGVLSFFLGTLALLCASLPGASFLIVPLAGAGILSAALGVVVPSARAAGVGLVLAGFAVAVPVLASACFWPALLHLPARATEDKSSADLPSVYRLARARNFQRVAPQQTEWVNASQGAVQQAGVRVRVAGVAVKKVPLQDPAGRRKPGEGSLVIRLRISNASADRLVEYRSWSAAGENVPRLQDDKGKPYPLRDFGQDQVVGQVRHSLLPMAKWVDDVLVFEPPPANIEWLRLELPGAGVGLEGQFRLEIPRRLIAFQ